MTLRAVGVVTAMALLVATQAAQATVYFNYDAESGAVGDPLPNPETGGGPNFWPFGYDESKRGRVAEGGAPQGVRYFEWQAADNPNDLANYVKDRNTFPIAVVPGRTYYLAHFMNITRINSRDVWHECTACQSADKGVFVWGNGLKWSIGHGQWDAMAANQDHRYTAWIGRSNAYNLNPQIDFSVQNAGGYGPANPLQLEYERWYGFVLAIRAASDLTGALALYVDGVKVLEHENIVTLADVGPPTIEELNMHGTIAQPAYDAPAHLRKYDALILTDNWQDIVNGGYLGPVGPGDTLAPAAPTSLSVQ